MSGGAWQVIHMDSPKVPLRDEATGKTLTGWGLFFVA
jgi:hypothetical protein